MNDDVPSRPQRRRDRAVWAAVVILLALALVILGSSEFTDWYCIAPPPPFTGTPPILQAPLVRNGDQASIGESWIAKKDGILRMYLAGDPFSLGYANARLTQHYMQEQEENLLNTVNRFVPSPLRRWLLKKYIYWMNRDLPEFVSPDYRLEIYGLSRGYADPFPEIAPLFHRLLNYHAAHDISHAVMDNPLVDCTSFAAWGGMTANGHLLVGRNLDFSPGKYFDEHKIVIQVKPDRGLGFLSVSWGGMAGVVSGINEARIAVTINAAQSSWKRRTATPVSLVMREVMQQADTLEKAVEIIKKSRVFVSDCYLVADGKTGTAVVVEKTPGKCGVRQADDQYLVCANHFLSPELKDDAANLKYMAEGTTVVRYDRMKELVSKSSGKLTPRRAAEILRDREVPGGQRAGYGNAAAINSLIATHSVVIDVTQGIIWVSRHPHQLGAYVPFGLDEFEKPKGAEIIPPDPMLANGSYERYVKSEAFVSRARELLKADRLEAAWQQAQSASELNPDWYQPWLLLGKIAWRQGRAQDAQKYLEAAGGHYPAYLSERREIQEMLVPLSGQAVSR